MVGEINISFLIKVLADEGLHIQHDIRLRELKKYFKSFPKQYNSNITKEQFHKCFDFSCEDLLKKAFRGELVVPCFDEFKQKIKKIYQIAESNTDGANADYIPSLEEKDPSKFAVAACTIDGQQCEIGDTDEYVNIQSCMKPIIYGMALEELGVEYVHKHVGKEPSGAPFNKNFLNSEKRPHNPLINAGAIMTVAMIQQSLPMYK